METYFPPLLKHTHTQDHDDATGAATVSAYNETSCHSISEGRMAPLKSEA